jgi:outer membrane receptor protein involved in Fe transport
MDLDLGPQPLLSAAPVASQDQVSQEFQLQSAQSATVAWLAGLYYIHIREQYDPTTFDYGGSYAAGLGGRIHQSLQSLGRASSYAAYGQATLPLGAATQLTAGLRYTVEDRSVQASGERTFNAAPFVRPIPGLPLLGQAPLRNAKTFEAATWRASLDHQFSDALMGYASISRGFQSGGWNLQSPQTPVYRPERIDAAEAGLKFSDPAVRISAETSAFFYKYADMQVSAFTPLGSMTTNAASADIYGLDAQVKARPGEATEVTAGAQVLQARYNSFPAATCTDFSPGAATLYAPVSCDATGNRLPFAPRLKLNLAANHRVELGEAGSLIFSGSVAYNSGYFSEPDNVIRQKAFATLDAQVEWRTAGRGPALRLWALNLTDTHYYDVLAIFPTVSVLYRPAAPRRVGASAIFAF